MVEHEEERRDATIMLLPPLDFDSSEKKRERKREKMERKSLENLKKKPNSIRANSISVHLSLVGSRRNRRSSSVSEWFIET